MSEHKKILIDARMVGERVDHGIARFVSSIAEGLRELQARRPLGYEPVFLTTESTGARLLAGFERARAESKFLSLREQFELPRLARAVDAFHSPSFSSPALCPVPWIVTLHDLCHLRFGDVAEKAYYRLWVRKFALGAARIQTVSEFSRKEISRWLGIEEEKIALVYNALIPRTPLDPAHIEGICRSRGLVPGRYFFCLSNPKPHKNTALLREAHFSYLKTGAPLPLVTNLPESSEPLQINLGRISDTEAAALRQGAAAFFFPSLYEGFGIPPLEAALDGARLALSDIPPHREALGEFSEVHWVQAGSVAEWTEAFHCAAAGKIAPLSGSSTARILQRFSLEKLGSEMDRLYRGVLGLNTIS